MNSYQTNKKPIIIICICIILLLVSPKLLRQKQIDWEYNGTWNLVIEGNYQDAIESFRELNISTKGESKYRTSISFAKDFCKMCIYYDDGDYRSSKKYKDTIDQYIKNEEIILNNTQKSYVDKMFNAIEETYMAHKAEYDAEDKAAEEARKAARKERETEEVARKQAAPYIGMSESKIDSTDIGKHSRYYEHYNTEYIKGKFYSASMYYWDSGGDCIYYARCVNGSVYKVWDNLDHHITDNIIEPYNGRTKKKSDKTESTTEFDPDDHDIELYYEDFKDDEGFDDIDDAYDDFMDHPEYWNDY